MTFNIQNYNNLHSRISSQVTYQNLKLYCFLDEKLNFFQIIHQVSYLNNLAMYCFLCYFLQQHLEALRSDQCLDFQRQVPIIFIKTLILSFPNYWDQILFSIDSSITIKMAYKNHNGLGFVNQQQILQLMMPLTLAPPIFSLNRFLPNELIIIYFRYQSVSFVLFLTNIMSY